MSPGTRRGRYPYFKIAGRRISLTVLALEGRQEPHLRFDRVAKGLIKRLQSALATTLPEGKVVVVTVTAPIRQASKTGAALEVGIRVLLRAQRARWKTTILGNRIEVRVLKGGASTTAKLIGFVHNPKPDASLLFDAARSVLACIGTGPFDADRWLIISNPDGAAPFVTLRHVCIALGASTVFKRIILEGAQGARLL